MAADGSKGAPVHLVMGHAGAGEMCNPPLPTLPLSACAQAQASLCAGLSYNVKPNQPDIFEVVKMEHGYMRVQANGTAFTVEVSCALVRVLCNVPKVRHSELLYDFMARRLSVM